MKEEVNGKSTNDKLSGKHSQIIIMDQLLPLSLLLEIQLALLIVVVILLVILMERHQYLKSVSIPNK